MSLSKAFAKQHKHVQLDLVVVLRDCRNQLGFQCVKQQSGYGPQDLRVTRPAI